MATTRYPEWLAKTGEPILWAYYKINGPKVISEGVVTSHRKGKVYITNYGARGVLLYGVWCDPATIKQAHPPLKEGDYLSE